VTKQRKATKKGTWKRNTRSKIKKESSDESEADSYVTDDGEVEILDYIEVEHSVTQIGSIAQVCVYCLCAYVGDAQTI